MKTREDPEEQQRIYEENTLNEVQRLDRALQKDLYVFRMAMARLRMPGARKTAFKAAEQILNFLEKEFGS